LLDTVDARATLLADVERALCIAPDVTVACAPPTSSAVAPAQAMARAIRSFTRVPISTSSVGA
jgi:hypothetical protein